MEDHAHSLQMDTSGVLIHTKHAQADNEYK